MEPTDRQPQTLRQPPQRHHHSQSGTYVLIGGLRRAVSEPSALFDATAGRAGLAGAGVSELPPGFVGTSADIMNAVETVTRLADRGDLDRAGAEVLSDAFAGYPWTFPPTTPLRLKGRSARPPPARGLRSRTRL